MPVIVKSGPLRHPVVIQRPVTVQDEDTGEPTNTWLEWNRAWCSLEPFTALSREKHTGAGLLEEAETVVRMRWCEGLKREHRLLMNDGTTLEILALADVQRRERMHEAICKAIVE